MVRVINEKYHYLQEEGHKPHLNILDNATLHAIKAFFKQQTVTLQLVLLQKHQGNAAECVIQTIKHYFIVALSTSDPAFSLKLWDDLCLRPRHAEYACIMHKQQIIHLPGARRKRQLY